MTTKRAAPDAEADALVRDSPDMIVPGAVTSPAQRRRLTVLTLLKEMRAEYDRQRPLLDEAEMRERIVLGEQWRGRDPMIERTLASMYGDDSLITENLLYPLSQTWIARVNQGR